MSKFEFQYSLVTLSQTCFMGMLDAYTFSHFAGAFASAQTGNLIIFGIELARNGWQPASDHLPVFFGFLLGAVFAQQLRTGLKKRQANQLAQVRWLMLVSIGISVTGMLLAALQPTAKMLLLALLGFFASYELTLFNRVGTTAVNNGIMTGNLKNIGNLLATFLSHPQKSVGLKLTHFGLNLVIFVIGVLVGAAWFSQSLVGILISGSGLNLILLLLLLVEPSVSPNTTAKD